MYSNKKVVVVIPAKIGSKRLHNKNLRDINGKTLTKHAYDYAKQSKFVDNIIISTDAEDLNIFGDVKHAIRHKRKSEHLDEAPLKLVIIDVAEFLNLKPEETIIVCVQPDHVGRDLILDESLDILAKTKNALLKSKELNGSPSGAYYMGSLELFYQKKPKIFSIFDSAINIHYLNDLERARKKINE